EPAFARCRARRARWSVRRCTDAGIEIDALAAGAMLDALIMARPLDEDAAHRERRGREEMAAPIPLLLLPIAGHAQVRLVDERRRLQRLRVLAVALVRQPRLREPAQFVVDFGQTLARGARSAVGLRIAGHSRGAPL